jgi:acetylglutamate kinase
MNTVLNSSAHTAEALMSLLPILQKKSAGIVVVKYGGSLLAKADSDAEILSNIAWLKAAGYKPVIIHGGGPAINEALGHFEREPQFIRGRRVTDDATMTVVEMVLSGQLNKAISARLQQQGCDAIGLSGRDMSLIRAHRQLIDGLDLGRVGIVDRVDSTRLLQLLDLGLTPVLSPVCDDGHGGALNVNADDVAVAVARALKAEQLVLLTDVPGVLTDINDPQSRIPVLTVAAAQEAILSEVITGGMIPKIQSAVDCIEHGVGQVRIMAGTTPHALLEAIVLNSDLGTSLVPNHLDDDPMSDEGIQ